MSVKQKSTYEKRREILDTPYKNGVKSVTGEGLGIRAMTEEEIKILDQFNKEFGCANISYDKPGLHAELMERNSPKIELIENQIKELKVELNNIKYVKSGPPLKTMRKTELKREINRKIQELEGELLELDVIKSIRHDNYTRSCDPLNYSKAHINIVDMVPPTFRSNDSESNYASKAHSSESDIITHLQEREVFKT
jgi:hypothetical protein